MSTLRTDYKNDILDTTQNEYRVYDIVNADGDVIQSNVHLEDKTVYTQTGDNFGAGDMNDQNTEINQLNSNLGGLDVRYDTETSKPQWKAHGADTWSFFSSDFGTPIVGNNIVFTTNPYTGQGSGGYIPTNLLTRGKNYVAHLMASYSDIQLPTIGSGKGCTVVPLTRLPINVYNINAQLITITHLLS